MLNLPVNLKSNMDRFIEFYRSEQHQQLQYLKSNMDRFIGTVPACAPTRFTHLKSNMDRFIEWFPLCPAPTGKGFKIQYG